MLCESWNFIILWWLADAEKSWVTCCFSILKEYLSCSAAWCYSLLYCALFLRSIWHWHISGEVSWSCLRWALALSTTWRWFLLEADSVSLLDAWSDLSLPFLWSLCSNISLDLIFWILELSPANPGFNTRLLSSSSSAGLVSLYLFLASLDSFFLEVLFILCYQSHSLRQKDIVSPIIISNFNIISNKSIGNIGYVHACFCWHCRHYSKQFSSVLTIAWRAASNSDLMLPCR